MSAFSQHLKRSLAAVAAASGSLAVAQDAAAVARAGEAVHQLERLQVVSTATRTERLLSEVPVRTELLTREDMQMRAMINFSQAVELINGVRVESNCQNCNTSEVQLLGLSGAYNQILFDGTPLLSSLGGVYGIEQIPTAFVDRLEVVKGGGSALYGAGAVAGAINLVPVQPREGGGFVQAGVDVQRGEPLWYSDGRLNVVSQDGTLGLSVVTQGSRNDAIDFNGDGYSEITEKGLVVAGVQAWFSPVSGTKVRASYQYTWEDRRGGNRLEQPEFLANIAESLQTRYHRGGLTWNQEVTPDFDFQAGYSFAFIERDSFYGGLGDVVADPSAAGYDASQLDPLVPGSAAEASFAQYGLTTNPLHYFDSQFNYRTGAHALAFGVQHKRESVRDNNVNFHGELIRITADDSYSNTGVFLQDEWSASSSLDVVAGARVDKSSELDDAVFSPRLALAFTATDRVKLRTGVSTGFRAPELFSEDMHVDTLGAEQVRIRNVEGLSEESAVTYSVGGEWRNDPGAPTWAFDVTGSRTEIEDTFVLGGIASDAGGALFQERTNASGSTIEGFEANLAHVPNERWRATAGVAWYRSRYDRAEVVFDDTADGGSTVIETRDYLKTPRWSGVAQVVWTPRKTLNVFAAVKYSGSMDVLNNKTATLNRTPEFWAADAGVTRHFELKSGKHIDVGLGVKNLFDERQRDLESGANRDSTYVYGPRFARSVYATIKYEF